MFKIQVHKANRNTDSIECTVTNIGLGCWSKVNEFDDTHIFEGFDGEDRINMIFNQTNSGWEVVIVFSRTSADLSVCRITAHSLIVLQDNINDTLKSWGEWQ